MPGRPRSIPWDERVSIFLDYRRLRKVQPTAKRHAVARSTVSAIVGEFVAQGFAEKPRARLSPELLCEMQEHHLAAMWPLPVGNLDRGPGTDDEAGVQAAEADPLRVTDEAAWHLKGTKAEQAVDEARAAVRDYLQRDREARTGLREALEIACGLREREGEDLEPHLLAALRQTLRNAFFDAVHRTQPPAPAWLRWDIAPADAQSVLRLREQRIAFGTPADHERIKGGVTAFLANGFREHQLRFLEVEALRRDLGLMDEVVHKTIAAVSKDDVRRGICPACPYPEGRADPEPDQKPVETKEPKTRKGGKR